MRFPAALILIPLICIPGLAQSLVYSTYLRDHFKPVAVATDSTGNVYVAGNVTVDTITQQVEPMIMKLDPAGRQILYSRILGGSTSDTVSGLAVDSAGNASVVGTALSPDFPVTPGRATGTAPTSATDGRAFLAKLDPQGNVLFSGTIGAVSNSGIAVATASQGQIVISGFSNAKGFPATNGAYHVPDTTGRPYLMELSADGSSVIFSATGIGGNSLAFDSSGNIFMAGASVLADYPTTPGAYQTKLNPVYICFGLCQLEFPGTNQYVTKVDPAGSQLLYSTGVAGLGSTANQGLAVDAAGNAYVTGTVEGGSYPFTVSPFEGVSIVPFVTKLDPTGAKALYSMPIGGAGIALSGGNVFAGGSYNSIFYGIGAGLALAGPPAGASNLNAACEVNNFTTGGQAYVTELDATTGQILSTVLVDSTDSSGSAIALASNGVVWLTASTAQADVPITTGAFAPPALTPGVLNGVGLARIDFTQAPAQGAPQVECILDAGTLVRLGPVAPNQLLTLMGANLNNAAITFDGQPATILYSSPSQINLAVPYPQTIENYTLMQVSSSAGTLTRQLPLALSEPSIFVGYPASVCTVTGKSPNGLPVVAANQDGSLNSCTNPARAGSIISFYLNGPGGIVSPNAGYRAPIPGDIPVAVTLGDPYTGFSAEVVKVSPQNDWMWRIDVLVPPQTATVDALVTVTLGGPSDPIAAGPLTPALPMGNSTPAGTPFPVSIWVGP